MTALLGSSSTTTEADPAERASTGALGAWCRRRRFRLAVLGLALASGVLAMVVHAAVFPQLSANSDEGAYLTQADALASGRLFPQVPTDRADLTLPWFSVRRGDHYVTKYTPPYAAVLAVAQLSGAGTVAALGAVSAAAVIGVAALARTCGAGRRAALVAAGLGAVSPLWLVQSAVYLPYLASLAVLLGVAVVALRARRAAAWVGVGALAGWAFFGRPYDAVLWCLPVLAWALVETARRTGRTAAASRAAAAAVGALPILALLAWFDRRATGHPLELPFNLLETADTLGFGLRRVTPQDPWVDFTPGVAAGSTLRNLALMVTWTAGGLVTFALAAWGLRRPRPTRVWLLVVLATLWTVGYGSFWGSYSTTVLWDGALFLGPYYFLPVTVLMCILAGAGAVRLWDAHRALAVAAAAVGLVLTATFVPGPLGSDLGRTERRRTVATAVEDALRPWESSGRRTLLLVPPLFGEHLQHPFSFLRNPAVGGGVRQFALGGADRDLAALTRFPGRAAFQLSVPSGFADVDSGRVVARVEPVTVVAGPVVTVTVSDVRDGAITVGVAGTEVAAGPDDPVVVRPGPGRTWTATVGDRTLRGAAADRLTIEVDVPGEPAGWRRELGVASTAGRVRVAAPGELVTDGLSFEPRLAVRPAAAPSGPTVGPRT